MSTVFNRGDEVLYGKKGKIISVNNNDGDIGYDVELNNGSRVHAFSYNLEKINSVNMDQSKKIEREGKDQNLYETEKGLHLLTFQTPNIYRHFYK